MPLDDGRKVVTTAGTAVQLAQSTRIGSVIVTALSTNTKVVAIGGKDVVAAAAERKGTPLNPGESAWYTAAIDHVDDLNQIWLDAEVNGEGVSYSYGHLP